MAVGATRDAFADLLVIHKDKVGWEWQPAAVEGKPATGLDVLLYSVMEADGGMDQNLNLSPDQKYMGGFEGMSSQGIRHMYYRGWTPLAALQTFHFPLHEMGFAPERAALFFDLARQLRTAGHVFWAYRFLGWSLHYIEDLGQPFHTSQFGSLRLLPLRVLLTVGWEPFVAETTRIVSNFHLGFERYAEFLLRPEFDSPLLMAFKVPKGDEEFKQLLDQKGGELLVRATAERLAQSGQELVSSVVEAENDFMGAALLDSKMNLSAGFYDDSGRPKLDFAALEKDDAHAEARKRLHDRMEEALSNTGVATRWLIDKFKGGTPDSN